MSALPNPVSFYCGAMVFNFYTFLYFYAYRRSEQQNLSIAHVINFQKKIHPDHLT